MTKLLWDQVGERHYETGLDRGVLYLSDGSGVPWSGLVSVNEEFSDDGNDPVYFDGIKQVDAPKIGNYAATLSALTYPDEFLEYEGVELLGNGLYAENQQLKTFGLSYRTLLGNDSDGVDHGYKVHILYNLLAAIGPPMRETLTNQSKPTAFTWSISAIPVQISGYRPTAHVFLDSTKANAGLLQSIEDVLYGTDVSAPRLPTIAELFTLAGL